MHTTNTLWLIWKSSKKRQRYKIGELKQEVDPNGVSSYTFEYTDPELNDARSDGFDFFPGFNENQKKVYYSQNLFENIKTRLLNHRRSDFLELLNKYNLKDGASDWEVLVATRGRLVTDDFEFVAPFDEQRIEFDVAGIRYGDLAEKCTKDCNNDSVSLVDVNTVLELKSENNNIYDPNAVAIYLPCANQSYRIGYVPRYYSRQIKELIDANTRYSAMISRLILDSENHDDKITINVKLIFDKNQSSKCK